MGRTKDQVASTKELFSEALLLEDKANRFGGTTSIDSKRTRKLYENALQNYHQILSVKPDSFDACFNSARLVASLAQMADASGARLGYNRQSCDLFQRSMEIAEAQTPETLLQQRMQISSWSEAAFSRANTLANIVDDLPDGDVVKLQLLDEAVRLMSAVVDKQVQLLQIQQQDRLEMQKSLQTANQFESTEASTESSGGEMEEDEEATELEETTWATIAETCCSQAQLLTQSVLVAAEFDNPSIGMAQEMVKQAEAACQRADEALAQHGTATSIQELESGLRKAQAHHAYAELLLSMGTDVSKELEHVIKEFDAVLATLQAIPGLEKRAQAGLTANEQDQSSLWTETWCDKGEACRQLALCSPTKLKPMLAASATSFSKACQILYPQAPFSSKWRIYARAGDVELLRMRLAYWPDCTKTPPKEAAILARNAVNYFKRMVNEGNGAGAANEQRQGLLRSIWAQSWLQAIGTSLSDAETVKQAQEQISLALHHLRDPRLDVKQALIADLDDESVQTVQKVSWPQ